MLDDTLHRLPGIDDLRRRTIGRIVEPHEADWDAARTAWQLTADQRPVLVALPETADDVATVVSYAAAHGLRVAPQGTGHGATALGPLDGTILLRTTALRAVQVDPAARTVRVEAGAVWGDVTAAAAEHGLTALAGSAADVGVVGYTLGGGLSWLARRHGLAAGDVLAAEVVTADGRQRRVDADNDPALFWALRGGGGSFAVVTALELRLHPVVELYAGALFWPVERAGEVLHAYRRWVKNVPDELTSCGRLLQLPPLPSVPAPLRGRAFVVVEAAYLGPDTDGAALLDELRRLGPEMDTFAVVTPSELARLHMDPDGPVPATGHGMLLADLPAEAVDVLVAVAGAGSGSPLLSVELRHLGGALGITPPGAGALGSLDAGFSLFAVGITPDAGTAVKVDGWLDVVQRALRPWEADRCFPNLTERPAPTAWFHDPTTLARLRRVKASYDPQDVIRANHPVEPAQAVAGSAGSADLVPRQG